jgi:predicted glycoside hydrolase/deacetylase ChbG (UPF0249 family)
VKRLIVNADDFGLTAGVSRGILEAHRRGIVTSTTLMASLPLDGALLDGLKVSRLGVGLHLNLTLGQPVSPAEEIPSLLDAGGKFFRDPLRQAAEAKPEEVELELRAQVAVFIRLLGRKPTHLDSHHHVGRHLPIRDIVFALAEELGIPLRCQDAETRRAASERGLRSPEHFFGESGPEAYWSSERLLAHLATLPDGVSEFMTHPGYFDQDLAYSRYGRQREVELRGLTDPAVSEAVAARRIRLCHFGELDIPHPASPQWGEEKR